MAKQLNVALDFTANTTQAKQQIQELQQLLTKVAYSTDLGVSPEQMQKASAAAKELAFHLNEAYNTTTGNYDLSKLNASLTKSKTNVTELSNNLLQAGATGQQAFVKLAQSIAAADQPMITLNARLQDFLTTVKNTVKWQISSSMIHGVMGALQGAYGYAQNLNSSLNDIRIVTGHNIDYMDKFADKANKAAKALSTSTLNYTDASLIYYQQGLSDQEVEDRTAVTIKMANAAGESADKVSQQLTAVWNNFYDGSQSLEYYADVMTALGAATASSTDEIAEGLEKFAAVSNTVGLSYEYATSALATVTATTRQSADVVGTAFKTLFARIQDLELGETLDDGTTLGKYSQALDAVGIEIKDATGGLRDMDDILSDLGEKWNSFDAEGNPLISKDAKVALAQTVAGVRQYTQLMALMDNWDFMKENLETAKNATGTLTEQQKIYEESWEAASNRLKVSFQGLYQQLIDDKFFIKFTNFLSDLVTGIDSFIDKIGGVKPLLIGILSLVGQALSSKIQPALNDVINNIRILSGGADKVYGAMRDELSSKVSSEVNRRNQSGNYVYNELQREQLQGTQRIGEAKQKLIQVEDKLSASERRAAETALQGMEMQQSEIERLTKKKMDAQKEIEAFANSTIGIEDLSGSQKQRNQAATLARSNMRDMQAISSSDERAEISQGIKFVNELIKDTENNAVSAAEVVKQKIIEVNEQGANAAQEMSGEEIFNGYITSIDKVINQIDVLKEQSANGIIDEASLLGVKEGLDLITNSFPPLMSDLDQIPDALGDIYEAKENLNKKNISSEDIKRYYESVLKLRDAVKEAKVPTSDLIPLLRNLGYDNAGIKKYLENLKQTKGLSEELEKRLKQLNAEIKNTSFTHTIPFSETLTSLASAAGSAYMAIQSLSSMIQTLQDPDASGWEKFGAVLMGFSMLVPSVISVTEGLTTARDFLIQQSQKLVTTMTLENGEIGAQSIVLPTNTALKIQNTLATQESAEAKRAEILELLKTVPGIAAEDAALIADTMVKKGATVATNSLSVAISKLWAALVPLLPILLPLIAVLGAAVVAIDLAITRGKAAQEDLDNTTSALEKTQSELDEVNTTLNTLSNTFDNLSQKREAIEDLTYGTTEWRQAVVDLNNEVSDLIKQYNLIKGQDWDIDSAGAMYLTNQGKENIQNQNIQKQKDLSGATSALEWQKSRKSLDINKSKIVDKYTIQGTSDAYGTPMDYQQITSKEIDALIQAKLNDETLNFKDPFKLKELGFDDALVNLVTSNNDLIFSLDQLAIATSQATDAYVNSIYNQLLDNGVLEDLKAAGVEDPEYASQIAYKMAEDVVNNTTTFDKDSIDLNNTNDSEDNAVIQAYLKAHDYGYKDDNNFITDWRYGTESIDVYTQQNENDEGWDKDSSQRVLLDDIKEWYAQEMSKNEVSADVQDYVGIEADSKNVWNAVDSANQKWGESDFSDTMDTLDQNINTRSQMLGAGVGEEGVSQYTQQIDEIKEKIQELGPELAAIFDVDVDSDAFKDILKDTEFLQDNAELLEDALGGDAEAVNELRDKYDEYLATADRSEKVINNSKEIQSAIEKINPNLENLKENTENWMSTFDELDNSTENFDDLSKYMDQNSDSLAKVAGMSETAFKKFTSQGKNAAKAALALKAATNGDVQAVRQLRAEAAKEILLEMNLDTDVYDQVQELQDYLVEFSDEAKFKAEIECDPQGLADFKNQCNQIISSAQMTQEQAEAYFAALGYDVELEEHEADSEPVTGSVTYAKFTEYIDGVAQFVPAEITTINDPPPTKTYTVKSITPTGKSGGGNAKIVKGGGSGSDKKDDSGGGSNNGGGGGSNYTPPPKKEYDDEIERYHVIKQKIEDLQEAMDHLAKAKDRAFGTSKLELMDQEIEKYNEMIDLQNQYLAEIEDYWKKDRDLIASYGAIFDDTGVIINYDEIMKRQIDKYNSSIGFNEDADDAAEDAYDDFIEALEQYEETNNLRQDELEKLYELQTELADVIFEKTQYKIEIKIAVKDDELEYLEYLFSKIEDDAYAAAEAIALMGEKAENALEKTKIYSEGLMELLSNHGINSLEELDNLSVDDLKAKEFTEDEIDQIREWKSSILEANQELLEMRNTIQEKVLDSFNQFSDDLQEQMDLFEHYQTILESVKDITSLLGTELTKSSKEVIRNLNHAMLDNNINNLASQKTVLETYQEQQKQAQAAYDHAKEINDTESIRQWEETLSEINDKVNEAEENFLDIWQETLEQAKDIYEEEMDNIAKDFEEGISPIYGAIDVLQDTIGRAREINEQYLEDYEKTYELNKLAREIQGSIDDTDIIRNKKKLSALQDEINRKLKDGTKMSEYDLKILQQKYELELAHQALDDAKNGNERVRLARDGNGNWGYIYTADEDKIAEAEQNYEDKLKAMQDANKEYLQTLEDNILALQQTWQQAISEINLSYANGEITKAEQEARIAEINEYYATRMEQLKGEYEKMFSNSQEFAERFQKYFKDVNLDIASSFDKTSLAIKTGYTSLTELFEGFWRSHDSYLTSATMLLEQYREKLSEVSSVAGTISSAFASEANGWAINITGNSKDVVADVEKIAKNATDSFNKVLEAASDFEQMYADRLDEIIKKNEDLVTSMREMIAALSGLETATFETNRDAINNLSTTTANNRASTMRNSETFNTYRLEQNENSLMAVQSSLIDAIDNFKPIEIDKTVSLADSYLESLDIDKILQYISSSVSVLVNQLGGLKSFIISTPVEHTFEQTVNINADFPNATDSSEILEAFDIMEEEASQFANKKSI